MKQECSYYTKQQHNHKHHVLPVEYRSMTLQDTKGEVQPVYVDTLGCVTEMHYVFSTQTYLQLIFGKCTQGFLCLIANLPYLRRGISCREKKISKFNVCLADGTKNCSAWEQDIWLAGHLPCADCGLCAVWRWE